MSAVRPIQKYGHIVDTTRIRCERGIVNEVQGSYVTIQ